MKIRVVAFATAAEALGGGEVEVEVGDGADLAALAARLRADHPALEKIWERLAVAVDGVLAPPETALRDGAEVALLPPVSGGVGRQPRLVDGAIDVGRLVAEVSAPSCGALVLFLGTARDHHQGRAVEGLTYDAYRPMAESALEQIVGELEAAAPDLRLGIVHRLGEVPVGEASVAIAAASPHREAAYAASRTALERLKREVPIWKQEHYAGGAARWREEEPLAAPATAVAGRK